MLLSLSLAVTEAVTPSTVVIVGRRSRRASNATRFPEMRHHEACGGMRGSTDREQERQPELHVQVHCGKRRLTHGFISDLH